MNHKLLTIIIIACFVIVSVALSIWVGTRTSNKEGCCSSLVTKRDNSLSDEDMAHMFQENALPPDDDLAEGKYSRYPMM